MIFFLSSDLARMAQDMVPEAVDGLQHLADSRRCGENEIIGYRQVLRDIGTCSGLSSSARAIYNRLADESTQKFGLLDTCCEHVEVVAAPSICERKQDRGRQKIVLSIGYLATNQRLAQKPVLLCENLDDCEFMTWIGKIYCQEHGLPPNVAFLPNNGGGSTTANVYEHFLSLGEQLCLCIVDGDLKYEGSTKFGETAERVLEVHSRLDSTKSCLYVLHCQEAENLIPAVVLFANCDDSDQGKTDAIRSLNNLQAETRGEPWRYVDVKEGMRVYQIVKCTNADYQVSWAAYVGTAEQHAVRCTNCGKNLECKERTDCGIYLLPGLGSRVLSEVVNHVFGKASLQSIVKLAKQIPKPIKDEWEKLGHLVVTWGFAGKELRC